MDLLARAQAAEHGWLRTLATTVDPVTVAGRPVGEVVLTAPIPRIRDHNALLLDAADDLDGDEVADLLDRELGDRGLAHRRLYAPTGAADRWDRGLRARGHLRDDVVVLRWPGDRPPTERTVTVVEADVDLAEASTRALRGADLDVEDPAAFLDQLAWLVRAQHAAGARVLVAVDDDRPVGHVRIFPGDGIAQVEELDVHPDVQRRGVGRALLAAALDSLDDVPIVFLTAEPDGWPAQWYRRLGFTPLGRSSGFVRAHDPKSS